MVKGCAALTEKAQVEKFFDKVNHCVDESDNTRNFAVIQMYAKQKLVNEGDMVLLRKEVPAKIGDRIKIEKVLLFGNENITLIGRPILDRHLVNVEAMVLEKTHSHTVMTVFAPKYIKGGFRRWYFQRHWVTILRITSIKVCHHLNKNPTVIQ